MQSKNVVKRVSLTWPPTKTWCERVLLTLMHFEKWNPECTFAFQIYTHFTDTGAINVGLDSYNH